MINGTTLQELQRLVASIDSTSDLRIVSGVIKDRWDAITRQMARLFNEGDTVRWRSKHGGFVQGTITQVNRKTIKVLVPSLSNTPAVRWSVSPNLLERVL